MQSAAPTPTPFFRLARRLMVGLAWLLAVCLSIVALTLGVLHVGIVPRIGHYTPQIERMASHALGSSVKIGQIQAHASAWVPSFVLRDVRLIDAQGREALHLPRVQAALSLASLLRLDFDQLYIDQPVLDVRRTRQGQLLVAGLDMGNSLSGDSTAAADWFLGQREFVIQGGTLRWVDDFNGVPPLALENVSLVLRHRAHRHALRLDATPPPGWGERFTLMGQFTRPLLSLHPGRWQDWRGQAYADFPQVDVSQLRRHLPGDYEIRQGQGALRAWVDVAHGLPERAQVDLALNGVTALLGKGLDVLGLENIQGSLSGQRDAEGFEIKTQGLQFRTSQGVTWPGGNLALHYKLAQGRQPASGRFSAQELELAALRQIASALPLGAGANELLARHPFEGRVKTVNARWSGDLAAPQSYQIEGRVQRLNIAARPGPKARPGDIASPGVPGIRGADVDVNLNQQGGTAHIELRDGALEFPNVFEDPVIAFESFKADLQWRIKGEDIQVGPITARFANADAQGQVQGAWRTLTQVAPGQSRYPGHMEIKGHLTRANGARVHRYLPLAIPQDVRHYVRDAVQQGDLSNVQVNIHGDILKMPSRNPADGGFHFAGRLDKALFAYVPRSIQPAGQAPWPALTELAGELVFDRLSMQVKNATARVAGARGLRLSKVQASIADFVNDPAVVVSAEGRGPLAEMLDVVHQSPLQGLTAQALAQAKASGEAGLQLRLDLPIQHIEQAKVQGAVQLAGNDVQLSPGLPALRQTSGRVSFGDAGFALQAVRAKAYGGETRLEGGLKLPETPNVAPLQIKVQGTASAEGLRQAHELGLAAQLARHASGAASYNANITLRGGQLGVKVSSNLQGVAMQLPVPFAKTADQPLPLTVEYLGPAPALAADRPPPAAAQDQWRVQWGQQGLVELVREFSGGGPARMTRGRIALGAAAANPPPLPAQGLTAEVQMPVIDLPLWRQLAQESGLSSELTPGAAAGAQAAALSHLPSQLQLQTGLLKAGGRQWNDLSLLAQRQGPVWRGELRARQVQGQFEYRQPVGAGAGRIQARLSRLQIDSDDSQQVQALLEEPASSLPAVDLVADDFELKGRQLGRLELQAVNRGAAATREWRLNRLKLSMPEGTLQAHGSWAIPGGAPPAAHETPAATTAPTHPPGRTALDLVLDTSDAGALLNRLGLKNAIRRGSGKLQGQLAWAGSPLSPQQQWLEGALNLDMSNGQFLKADPGAARLLGVLSLQSLPRRLTLDFRDVFSEGFQFDFIRGDVSISHGVAITNNLQMKGVSAAVLLEGHANLVRETQALRVVVVPEINAGTASLVTAVINPAIGLGTFLAQMFLRKPLMEAATQEFRIDGTWSDPTVTKVPHNIPAPAQAPPDASVTPDAAAAEQNATAADGDAPAAPAPPSTP